MSYEQKTQLHVSNARPRYSNTTVTLTEQSAKSKSHPADNSARWKSSSREFSLANQYTKVTLNIQLNKSSSQERAYCWRIILELQCHRVTESCYSSCCLAILQDIIFNCRSVSNCKWGWQCRCPETKRFTKNWNKVTSKLVSNIQILIVLNLLIGHSYHLSRTPRWLWSKEWCTIN